MMNYIRSSTQEILQLHTDSRASNKLKSDTSSTYTSISLDPVIPPLFLFPGSRRLEISDILQEATLSRPQ